MFLYHIKVVEKSPLSSPCCVFSNLGFFWLCSDTAGKRSFHFFTLTYWSRLETKSAGMRFVSLQTLICNLALLSLSITASWQMCRLSFKFFLSPSSISHYTFGDLSLEYILLCPGPGASSISHDFWIQNCEYVLKLVWLEPVQRYELHI